MRQSVPTIIVAFLTAFISSAATYAGEETHPHPCVSVEDAAARLACYDEAFDRPAGAVGPISQDGHDEETDSASSKAREEFGLSAADKRARDPETAKKTQPESIEGVVAGLNRRATGEFIVTLDNGQVWMQAEPDTPARLKQGDRVTIRKAALGSFQLVTPGRIAMRVRRVQ